MRQAQQEKTDTANRILDAAERLVQVRGFNAFSYADVAAELALTNAALHYHFPSKPELGEALLARYAVRFEGALREIDESVAGPRRKLQAYADLYADVLRNRRMCLCGMLAAEYETLSPGMQRAIADFFEMNETWLARILQQGRDDGGLSFAGSPLAEARSIVSGLEGAMLISRSFDDSKRFESAATQMLAALRP